MHQQFDQFSQGIDLVSNLGIVTLSGSQELISSQFDSAQSFIALGSQQMRTLLSNASAVQEPEQWPEAKPSGLRNAIQMTRNCVLTVANYQMEGLCRLQRGAAETRQLFAKSLSEQLPKIKPGRSGDKKTARQQLFTRRDMLHGRH